MKCISRFSGMLAAAIALALAGAACGDDGNARSRDDDNNQNIIFPKLTVEPTSGLVTSEKGEKAKFTVVLTTRPSADVTVAVTSSDESEGTVSLPAFTFTTEDWGVERRFLSPARTTKKRTATKLTR